MRILIDFTQIPLQKAGVGIYALNLVSAIFNLDKENEYFIVIQNDEHCLDLIQNQRFRLIKVPAKIFRRFVFRLFLEQIYLPLLALKHGIDVLHSLHYSFPIFSPAKKIATIHDMALFLFPKEHLFIKVYYFRFFIYLSSKIADTIIVDSYSTRNDFLKKFGSEDKVRVVYLGRNKDFSHEPDLKATQRIMDKYKIEDPYLLFIGTIEPRKNIGNLIHAFDKLINSGAEYKLVISGKKIWYFNDVFRLVNKLSLEKRVIFTGFIEEEEKPYLIKGARVFVFPSIYEGFGIPVLEALSCGVPTVTSNVSSLTEVAGDAALLVKPNDVNDLYSGIKRLLDDEGLCSRLRQKAILQANKFSWEKTALETIQAYDWTNNKK